MSEVTVRGVQFHYESRGSGEVLLCLPGALGTGESDFAPQLEELARYYRGIAPEPLRLEPLTPCAQRLRSDARHTARRLGAPAERRQRGAKSVWSFYSLPRYPVLFPATDHTQSAPSGGYT
jgi:hypothetical protein